MRMRWPRNLLFGLLLAGFLYYAWRFIELSSITINGTKYYILFDDAMISMRYAYNIAHGLGAVWNAGERVEGFTNPLWVGFMTLIHLLPIPLAKTSLVVQWTGALFMLGTLYFVRRIVEHFTDDLFAMLGAVALTAFYAPLISWDLLGMEVSLLACLLSGVTVLILNEGERFNPWVPVLLGLSTLVRFDMAVPALVILAVLFIAKREQRRPILLWGLGALIVFLGVQTLARWFYYGEWLPNTYYLKVEGWNLTLRILRGLYALTQFAYTFNWVLFLLPLGLLLFRRDWKVMLLLALAAGQAAYSVYVGGDAWEEHGGANRYIAISMPVFFAALMVTVEELRKRAQGMFASHPWTGPLTRLAWLILLAFTLLNVNALIGEWKSIERWSFQRRPDYTAGNENNLRIALALQETTRPGASVAVIGAGTIPYLLPDRYAIDLLGKADPLIAHGPVRAPMSIADIPNMRPGHMKWNYARSLGELEPDVIVSLWEGTSAEAEPYLQNYAYAVIGEKIRVYLKKDSPYVLWDRVIIKD